MSGHRTPRVNQLAGLQPLKSLSRVRLNELVVLCNQEKVERGNDPFRLWQPAETSTWLLTGELKMRYASGLVEVMVGGTEAAQWPLGRGKQTLVECKAITDIEILRVDDDTVDLMMTWDQLTTLHETPTDPVPAASCTATLTGIFMAQSLTGGLFANLPPAHFDSLYQRFERLAVKKGQVVVRQGDIGDYYYVIDRGRAEVTREVGGAAMPLAELSVGEAFGEDALVSHEPRNATVTMLTDGILLRLNKADFEALLEAPLLHPVTMAEAADMAGVQWIDVRFPAEFRAHALPGARNIPLNEIRDAAALFDPKNRYIVYCQSGRRSAVAAFLLSQRGLNVSVLEGGLKTATAEKVS